MGVIYTVPDPWKSNTSKLSDLVPTDTRLESLPDVGSLDGGDPSAESLLLDSSNGRPGDLIRVRRPLAGIRVKPETHAYVQVVRSDGTVLKVFNELGSQDGRKQIDSKNISSPQDKYWTDWSLQSVSEVREEKIQITETFGDPVFYVFGERPRFLRFQGFLVNTSDFPWRAQFWENWDKYFRATKLVENNSQIFIGFDEILVSGYPVNATATQVANDPNKIVFNFSLYVVNYTNFTMRNAGFLHSLRNRSSLGNQHFGVEGFEDRLQEYLGAGRFADRQIRGDHFRTSLQNILGGERLEFQQFMSKIDDALGGNISIPVLGTNFTVRDLILSPSLRYIRGGKTAAEVLSARLIHEANKLAYAGVDELAAVTPGGQAGLQFWFGAVHQLYEIGMNIAFAVNPDLQADSRWSSMADNMAQMGNPFGVASYMGYAVNSTAAAGLYSTIDKWELSNLKYTSDQGVVARGQTSEFGAGALEDPGLFNTNKLDSTTTVISGLEDQSGWEAPDTSSGGTPVAGSNTLGEQGFSEDQDAADQEQAAVSEQQDQQQTNYGAMNIVEDPEEVEDDGSDEV